MRNKAFIILTALLIVFITTSKLTKITKTNNGILFKPMGQLIPELSWATLKIQLNITQLFVETDELCKASYLMEKEYNKMKRKYGTKSNIPPNKIKSIQAHLMASLKNDIERM